MHIKVEPPPSPPAPFASGTGVVWAAAKGLLCLMLAQVSTHETKLRGQLNDILHQLRKRGHLGPGPNIRNVWQRKRTCMRGINSGTDAGLQMGPRVDQA